MKNTFIIIILAIIVIGVGIFAYIKLEPQKITIPQELKQENQEKKLIEYVPGWLPGTYKIDQDSFSRQEGQVFVFSATDDDRNRLFFSQQPIPKDFDFEKFYNTKVVDPIQLEQVPYDSVFARDPLGKTKILSIKTDFTWIMMSTQAPIDKVMAQKIAQEMKRY